MMKRTMMAVVLTFVICLPLHAAVPGGTLYGIDVPGNLFRIDLSNGAGTLVGNLPDDPGLFENFDLIGYNEIEFHGATGRAWAQQRNGNFAAQEFGISNGAGIGAPVPNGASWHGLEFIGDTLLGAGFAGDDIVLPDAAFLATLDPETGQATVIGETGTDGPLTGLAFDRGTQTLFGIDNGDGPGESMLYTLDRDSGAATAVGLTGIRAGSLEFGPDGNLYAGGVAGNAGNLYTIDPTNASSQLLGATGFGTGGGNGISGLALVPVPAAFWLFASALLTIRLRRWRPHYQLGARLSGAYFESRS